MSDEELKRLHARLNELDFERKEIVSKIANIQKQTTVFAGNSILNQVPETPEDKRELFLKLFRCRQDIYPKRWDNLAQNKSGYSPVCLNEWKDFCPKKKKLKVKCGECTHHNFAPLDETAIKAHLQGSNTIGTYAITENDTCIFLACDFDGEGWKEDVLSYKNAATELSIEVAIEISRSGNGAHAWIFFNEFISARLARQIGTLILSKATEGRPQIKLGSYDRFFPNQDFIPKGGFGNLIALPLQFDSRKNNCTVFVDEYFIPFENQWAFLAKIRRLSNFDVTNILGQYVKSRPSNFDQENDDFQLVLDEGITEVKISKDERLQCDGDVHVTLDSKISIEVESLPPKVIAKIKRMATFPNPEFYKKNRMRMSTFGEPRLIFTGELQTSKIIVPMGLLEKIIELFKTLKAKVILHDNRPKLSKSNFSFHGELTDIQKEATKKMLQFESGVLVAPPGAGKTVMACSLIAERKVPTLVIVNKDTLLSQWKERLSSFLKLSPKQIGVIKGSRKKPLGTVDIAMMQSLTSLQDLSELPQYGQIIIDECHHIPCVTFEDLLKRIPTQFILGLTATPYRKDRLEKIIYFYCGPIRHEITSSEQIEIPKLVHVKRTAFKLIEDLGPQPPIHLVWEKLIQDNDRNSMIAEDLLTAMISKRVALVLSDRKEHLKTLEEKLLSIKTEQIFKTFKIESGDGKKKRAKIIQEIENAIQEKIPLCLFATASLIGEGFDLPRLDTLFLPMPLSFKGRMIQYAGRLHRKSEEKRDVLIYDYLDFNLALTLKMYRNRQKTYKTMGYTVVDL